MFSILILAVSILTANTAFSAETPEVTVSWKDCQKMALLGNPSLSASALAIEASRRKYLASYNAFLPKLSVSNSFNRSGDDYTANTSWSARASASETLFSLKSVNSIRQSGTSLERARANHRQTSAAVRYDLLSAFIKLLFAQENITVAERIYKLRESNSRMVSLQYEGGTESKGNMMRAQALDYKARAALSQSKRLLLSSQRELARRLGMDEFRALTVTGTLKVPVSPENADPRALAEKSPKLLLARISVKQAREQLSSARADIFPTLSASQSLNWRGETEFPSDRSWSMGVTLSLPLFSNGPTHLYNNTKSYKQTLLKSEQDLRAERLTAVAAVEEAILALEAANDDVLVNDRLLEAARQRYMEARVRYMAGRMNFQNWETIEQDLVNSERSYLQSLKTVNIAKAVLDKLLGIPLGENP